MGDGRLSDEQREQVMTLVEQAVDEDPDVGSKALQEKIQEEVPAVADLSVQQFHARYPLQVKRRRAREREEEEEAAPAKPEPKTPEPGDEARARIRDVILGFGREVAAADREELVGVFENLDNYVDEILEVAEQ